MARDLMDDDGENRAVRSFLALYGGTNSVTTHRMREHLAMSGFANCWPTWTVDDMHLTKGGAQNWLRFLFALESKSDVSVNTSPTPENGNQPANKGRD
jgi:hypothetical protein